MAATAGSPPSVKLTAPVPLRVAITPLVDVRSVKVVDVSVAAGQDQRIALDETTTPFNVTVAGAACNTPENRAAARDKAKRWSPFSFTSTNYG
jgi:hypothetical protein